MEKGLLKKQVEEGLFKEQVEVNLSIQYLARIISKTRVQCRYDPREAGIGSSWGLFYYYYYYLTTYTSSEGLQSDL